MTDAVPADLWRLGVIAVALLVGAAVCYRWVVIPERQRTDTVTAELVARAGRLETEVKSLNAVAVDKLIPALVLATTTTNDAQQLIRSMQVQAEAQRLRGPP